MSLSRSPTILLLAVLLVSLATIGVASYAQTTTASPRMTNITILSTASSPSSCYVASDCPANALYGYSPTTVTVVVGLNNTVVWTNDETGVPHSVTSLAGDPASFDSGCLGSGCSPSAPDNFTYTFTVPGTYYYHCIYHAWMEGEVIVLAPSSTTTSTTTSSGIPEFPYQPLALAAIAVIVVLSYMALRPRRESPGPEEQAPRVTWVRTTRPSLALELASVPADYGWPGSSCG